MLSLAIDAMSVREVAIRSQQSLIALVLAGSWKGRGAHTQSNMHAKMRYMREKQTPVVGGGN